MGGSPGSWILFGCIQILVLLHMEHEYEPTKSLSPITTQFPSKSLIAALKLQLHLSSC